MRIAGLIKNDLAAAPGVCVSVFIQGCRKHCPGCHNPETWDFNGGKPVTEETYKEILDALTANGVLRDLCIMGGEPLAPENREGVYKLISYIREHQQPGLQIWLWTGYTMDYLLQEGLLNQTIISKILAEVDAIIDGPYIQEQRDITLRYRGSSNQGVWVKAPNKEGFIRKE